MTEKQVYITAIALGIVMSLIAIRVAIYLSTGV
jgi:hypothetical protein